MDEMNNSQFSPIQTPEPAAQNEQPNTVTNSTTKKHGNGKKIGLLIAVFLLLLGGGSVYVISKNKLNPKAAGWGSWASIRLQENYWDGNIHTNTQDCYNNQYVCHANGSLVFAGGSKAVWKSDPAKNSTGKKLTSPTWDGPYFWSPGPTYNDYFVIPGDQRLCFLLKDVSKNGNAKIAIVVRNARSEYNYPNPGPQEAKTVFAIEGSLKSTFKKKFQNVCVRYYNPTTAYKQAYRLYVKSGQVEIDSVYQAFLYYSYEYNPYPYSSGLRDSLLGSVASEKKEQKAAAKANSYTCSTLQKKVTENCSTESQDKVSDFTQQLTEVRSVNFTDAQE